MKKLIGTAVLAALVATSAFAEISLSGWGRGLWSPIGYDGDAKMTKAISWGGVDPRVGITVAGNSENIGFVFCFNADGGVPGIHDVANVWAKPWEWLKISIGMIQDDTLRVNAVFGQFNWLRTGAGWTGEDFTFRRIGGYGGFGAGGEMHGAEIALTPVEGLYIAAGFKMDGTQDFVDVLKVSQYAVGYKIDDLIAIKAQYAGATGPAYFEDDKEFNKIYKGLKTNVDTSKTGWVDDDYYGVINAAVDLLMIEDNFISIGAFIPTDFDRDAVTVSAAYNGGFDALTLNALAAVSIKDGAALQIGVGVGYDFGNGLGFEADARTQLTFPEEGDTTGNVTIGAFFTKGFSNGICGIGAEVAIPFGDGNKVGIVSFADSDSVSFAIPVKVEYWF